MTHVVLANKHYLGLAGGAERNISDLANWLAGVGYRVTIVSEDKHGVHPAYPVRSDVAIVVPDTAPVSRDQPDFCMLRYLGDESAETWARNSYPMRKRWGRTIRALSPNVIVTYMPHTSTPLLQELGDEFPILVTNQNDPDIDYFSDKHGADPIDARIRLESLDLAAAVHFLIPTFVAKMPPPVQNKAVVIPNVVPPHVSHPRHIPLEQKRIVAVGRLVPQKSFDLLISAFAKCRSRHAGWGLHIFGDGPEKERLGALIRRHRLQRAAFLHGFTPSVQRHLDDADIFVIPSQYEGWGLSLTEAMAAAVPCIGFSECSGVNWLITHGETGLLVERNAATLADAIDRLAADQHLRLELGKRAREHVQQFAPANVYACWRRAIDTEGAAHERNHGRDPRLQCAQNAGTRDR